MAQKPKLYQESDFLEMLRDILEKADYKVSTTSKGYRCFRGRSKKQKAFINWIQNLILKPQGKVF